MNRDAETTCVKPEIPKTSRVCLTFQCFREDGSIWNEGFWDLDGDSFKTHQDRSIGVIRDETGEIIGNDIGQVSLHIEGWERNTKKRVLFADLPKPDPLTPEQLAVIETAQETFKAQPYDPNTFSFRDPESPIMKLEAEVAELRARCEDTTYDCTDFACPGWWRGHEHATKITVNGVNEWLDGRELDGTYGYEPLNVLRDRITALVNQKTEDGAL